MMKFIVFLTMFFFSHFGFAQFEQATSGTSLSFSNGQIKALVSWEQGPQSPDESIMQIEWQNSLGQAIEPNSFRVILFMPAMGHGSAPTQINRVLDQDGDPRAGVFRIVNMYFTMGGDWDVQVVLISPNGSKETQVVPVHLTGGGGPHHGH